MPPSREVLDAGYNAYHATEPDKMDGLSLRDLQSHYQAMSKHYPYLDTKGQGNYERRMEVVRREIEMRRNEERSERQHREAFEIGKKTLRGTEKTVFWARLAVAAGVVVPVALYVISEIYSSKTQRAKNEPASRKTFLQSPTPTAAAKEPEASSNNTTPSPEQMPTAQP